MSCTWSPGCHRRFANGSLCESRGRRHAYSRTACARPLCRGVMFGWGVWSTKSSAKNCSTTSNCLFLEHLRYSGEPQLSRHRMRSSYSFLCLSWSLLNLRLADLTQCAADNLLEIPACVTTHNRVGRLRPSSFSCSCC